MNLSVKRHMIHINGKPFSTHKIIRELGSGANGIVYLAKNILLDRLEAIKIWRANRAGDRRDKTKQALSEARKLAAANREYSVEIFSAQIFEGVLVATMEYVDGRTLREVSRENPDTTVLLGLAYMYLRAIEETTTDKSMHGDPHLANVLVYRFAPDAYTDLLKIKMCDFGTSMFSGKEYSYARHWRIVEESILELTRDLDVTGWALSKLQECKQMQQSVDAKELAGFLSGKQIAQVRNAPLRDYLECIAFQQRSQS